MATDRTCTTCVDGDRVGETASCRHCWPNLCNYRLHPPIARAETSESALASAHRFVTETPAQDILPASARLWRALEEDDYAAALTALTEDPR